MPISGTHQTLATASISRRPKPTSGMARQTKRLGQEASKVGVHSSGDDGDGQGVGLSVSDA